MHGDMRYTKDHNERRRKDNRLAIGLFYYTEVDEENYTAFFDAFVMTYFPNITKREKDLLGIDELFDMYGNRIVICASNKLVVIIKGEDIPVEVEHMYDRLMFEVIEKVQKYDEDMEIGR